MQEFDDYHYKQTLLRLSDVKMKQRKAKRIAFKAYESFEHSQDLFWKEFDRTVLHAVWSGVIKPLKPHDKYDSYMGNCRFITVKVNDIYRYQLKLLKQIEKDVVIPFKYKTSAKYLNTNFYRRQGYEDAHLKKPYRQGNKTINGLKIIFKL